MRHADRREKPDLGRRGALVLDVADNLLGGLALVALPLHPLVEPGLFQGAVEEDEELDVAVEAGLGQRRQVAQHVVPLPAAHPVRVKAAVESVQAVVGVDEESQRGLRRPLATTTHQTAPGQLLQFHRHYGTGAVFLDVVLEALHSHGDGGTGLAVSGVLGGDGGNGAGKELAEKSVFGPDVEAAGAVAMGSAGQRWCWWSNIIQLSRTGWLVDG